MEQKEMEEKIKGFTSQKTASYQPDWKEIATNLNAKLDKVR